MSDAFTPRSRRPLRVAGHVMAFGVLCLSILVLVVLGHDGRRVAQLMALAVPVPALLLWPVRSRGANRWRAVVVWAWSMAFVLDSVARAYLLDAYQAAPDSTLVLSAVANTTARESAEYLSMYWRSTAVWCAVLVGAGAGIGACARRGALAADAGAATDAGRARGSRAGLALLCALLLVSAVAYASKPWRRLHPTVFWTGWAQSVHALRAGWGDQEEVRDKALAHAASLAPVITRTGPATVVLVITESVNRDNMSLYGYARSTTPRLLAQQTRLGDQLLVLRNAWSVDASTVPALRNLFGFGMPASAHPPHLLALARAGGYKVWWIGNQDDLAIEQTHARFADVVDMANRTPGRASTSLDGEIPDHLRTALQDAAPRKFIVVHLMGAHPHYRLRFPTDANPFDDSVDAVETDLIKKGRSAWVRHLRHEYDAALLYQDFVVSELLRLTREAGPADSYRAWMYLSDHGQEVAHETDRAGHSAVTAAGYRIPALIWQNREGRAPLGGTALRPFRADWTGWTMTDLLNLEWRGDQPTRNVLHPDYRWRAPELPMPVATFSD